MMRNKRNGYTLIEMLVALLIICILIGISVPLFTSFIQNYRISANADDLYYYLQYARSEAVKRDTNVYVSFHTGDTWCYGVNVGSACDCTAAGSCGLATVSYGSAQQQTLSTSGMNDSSFYFEGTHSAASKSCSVTFTQYGQSSPLITISVGYLGNIQQCATGISGYTAC